MKSLMKPARFLLITLLLALCLASPAGAVDFGVLANTDLNFTGTELEVGDITWRGLFVPWFSALLGSNADLYVSAGVHAMWDENKEHTIVPELFRAELDLRFGQGGRLKVGRTNYSDPLGFIASGLFDGVRFSHNLGNGSFHTGAYYTGLLFKKTANITMTWDDAAWFSQKVEYDNFYDTYFASKRILAEIGFDHPAFMELLRVQTSFIAQFDMNPLEKDNKDENNNGVYHDTAFHSQYFTGKVSLPLGRVIFEGGGALEIAEAEQTWISGAAEASISFLISSSLRDRFLLLGRFAPSGGLDDPYAEFTPVTTVPQGSIFQGKLGTAGLSLLRAEYTARLHETFSFDLSSSFFFKNEKTIYPVPRYFTVDEGYFVGSELFARLTWSPVSDIMVKLGGGAFIPRSDSDPIWKAGMGAVFSIY